MASSRLSPSRTDSGGDVSVGRSLHEHPPVPFAIRRVVQAPVRLVLGFAKDDGAGRLGLLVVPIDVVDIDQHPIHDVGDLRPFPGMVTDLDVSRGTLVVGAGPSEHHHGPPSSSSAWVTLP